MNSGNLLDALIDEIAARVANELRKQEPASEPASPWLDVKQAADYCCMTPDAIRAADKRGQIRAHRSETGRVRFKRADLDAFLAAA
jgi:excisionase family DNA binding protein